MPSPSEIRKPTPAESQQYNVKWIIDGIPERRITREELIKMYRRMHNWLHELNPYTKEGQSDFHHRHSAQLWIDLQQLSLFLQRHTISIQGEGFLCVLHDKIDGQTKVIPLSKVSDLPTK